MTAASARGACVWANPEVVALQARLLNNSYRGPGRWILFDPASRRSFLAVGPDVIPDAIRILARAAAGAAREDLEAEVPAALGKPLDGLIGRGLLLPAPIQVAPPIGCLWQYHRANLDYPFHNYSNPEWADADLELMRQYAAITPPPPPATARSGQRYRLPPVTPDDLRPAADACALNLLETAAVLRYAFGPIAEVPSRFWTGFRKTSPSGGARHPTEGILLHGGSLEGIPPGAFAYDVVSHELVRVEGFDDSAQDRADVAFLLRLRVERPMWRYREIRALRPVLLDLGHIAETVALLLGMIGRSTTIMPAPFSSAAASEWLAEPEALLLSPTGNFRPVSPPVPPADPLSAGERYITSPALALSFTGPGLRANVVWPEVCGMPISLDAFQALNHCIPSSRGDRSTTPEGIRATAPGLTTAELERLIAARALLPYNATKDFYQGASLWAQHGWYFSMLAHLECRARQRVEKNGIVWPLGLRRLASVDVLPSLLQRRTQRSFREEPMETAVLCDLLARCWSGTMDSAGTHVFCLPLNVTGLSPRISEWTPGDGLKSCSQLVTREEVRNLTIGQGPAGSGSLSLWLVKRLGGRAAAYEFEILSLGMLAQRICVAATANRWGVFLTPGLNDSGTARLLGFEDAANLVIYHLTIGAADA